MNKVPSSTTYWSETAGSPPETHMLAGDVEADTVVVGAGFTGLRTALTLAEAGQVVTVLEGLGIGSGASGRNGGQVNPLPPVYGPAEIKKQLGPSMFERFARTYLDSADELFEFIRARNIKCQPRQCGWFRVDHCHQARRENRQIAEAWNLYDARIEFMEGDLLRREVGSKAFQTGIFVPKGGAIQPLSYTFELARCAMAAGASIYTYSPALSLRKIGEKWEVQTSNGRVVARSVVLCTNGYTDGLLPGLARSIVPLISIQAVTEPLPDPVSQMILPKGGTLADTQRTIFYSRREADNRLLVGTLGRMNRKGNFVAFETLRKAAERIFPSVRGVRWEHFWGGRIAITRDYLPHLHEPEPGVYAGLGYNGRGVAISNVMGRTLAHRLLGATDNELPFPITPIKAYPGHRFHSIGVGIVMRYMRMLDEHEIKRG